MKESEFIRQNKKRWSDFESELKGNKINPQRVANHYIKIIDDLSYARTHYKNRLVRSYLNGVSQILSLRIYKSQRGSTKGILKFWKTDLPLVMYHSRWELLISFLVFFAAAMVGVVSGMNDAEFLRYILGDGYVDMTLENIAKNDPMAVYKDDEVGRMFFGITINNILVSAYVFSLGILLGIGTIMALVYNGVMLGAFQQFFFTHDVGFESMLTIWQHGTIEISAIIVAGAAGIALSKGILFPGTFSRLDAFRISGRKGLIMMLGLMPLLVYSGFIEAFVTRMTDVHWTFRLGTILLSLFFVVIYFIWYPRRVAKNKRLEEEINLNIQPLAESTFQPKSIQPNTVVASFSWKKLIKHRSFTFTLGAVISAIIATIMVYHDQIVKIGTGYHWTNYFMSRDLLATEDNLWLFGFNFLTTIAGLISVQYILTELRGKKPTIKSAYKQGIVLIICAAFTAFCLTDIWISLCLIIWVPLCGLILASNYDEGIAGANRVSLLSKLLRFGWIRQGVLAFVTLFLSTLILYIFEETLAPILYDAVYTLLPEKHLPLKGMIIFSSTFLVYMLYYLLITFSILSNAIAYDTLKEQVSAQSLIDTIQSTFNTDQENVLDKKQLLNRSKIHAR